MSEEKHIGLDNEVNEDDVKLKSFKSYPSSEDGKTKVVNGEKVVKDFHMYDSENEEEHDEEEEHEDEEEDS